MLAVRQNDAGKIFVNAEISEMRAPLYLPLVLCLEVHQSLVVRGAGGEVEAQKVTSKADEMVLALR